MNGRSPWFQQDNAPCHGSQETRANLHRRQIPTIRWLPYSPDLNLIEHVWSWMERYIHLYHSIINCDPSRIRLDDLYQIIQEAWLAVPDEFITRLDGSRWDRLMKKNEIWSVFQTLKEFRRQARVRMKICS